MRIHVPVCLIYLDFLWHQIPQPIRHHSLVEPDIFFPAAISELESISVSAGQGKVSKPWAPVHHHNMSKNFTLHFYLCIILPSNIIISHSCVISTRNQNDAECSLCLQGWKHHASNVLYQKTFPNTTQASRDPKAIASGFLFFFVSENAIWWSLLLVLS